MTTRPVVRHLAVFLTLAALAGCKESDNPLGPDAKYVKLEVLSGNAQFGGANTTVFDPLRVRVSFLIDGLPANRAVVHWKVISGEGAKVDPIESRTDESGITSTKLTLSGVGAYQIEASVLGSTATRTVAFTATAVESPIIESVSPLQARAGDTIIVRGRNFSATLAENSVLFDGVQGNVLGVTANELRAVVPQCIPARTVNVVAALGAIKSPSVKMQITANLNNLLQMSVGQVVMLPRTADQSCVQFPDKSGALYLVVAQNVARGLDAMPFQLVGLAADKAPIANGASYVPTMHIQDDQDVGGVALKYEARMRKRESAFDPRMALVNQPQTSLVAASQMEPHIGDVRRFTVQNKEGAYVNLDAEIKAFSRHAIVYQEVGAPANGFSDDDFLSFIALIEDPIYDTDTRVFGAPSDVDLDGRISVVMTSVVNRYTDPTDPGFVAGFFDPCDLQQKAACPSSNRGEIFYTIVPDGNGVYGKKHPADDVQHRIPNTIAHEFMHMIHYNQRLLQLKVADDEDSWIKEALAHMAEDTVAGVFLERGDLDHALDFLKANYIRANYYLNAHASTGLIYYNEGSLEERGAGWLLIRYLTGHVPGTLLSTLVRSRLTGVATLETATGMKWEDLLSYWGVALWADNAPELGETPVDKRYTFTNMNLRDALGTSQAGFNYTYGLRPTQSGFVDFMSAGALPAGSQEYMLLDAGANPQQLIVNLTGARGALLPTSSHAQVSILRVR